MSKVKLDSNRKGKGSLFVLVYLFATWLECGTNSFMVCNKFMSVCNIKHINALNLKNNSMLNWNTNLKYVKNYKYKTST